jgi:hypothetical protein
LCVLAIIVIHVLLLESLFEVDQRSVITLDFAVV